MVLKVPAGNGIPRETDQVKETLSHWESPVLEKVSRLVCTCPTFKKRRPGTAPFCPHLQEVYAKNLDAVDEDGNLHQLPFNVEVVVLRQPDVRVGVHLSEIDANEFRKAFVITSDAMDVEFIGFVTPHDGRRVLRRMVQEWIQDKSLEPSRQCDSPHHFGKQPEYTAASIQHSLTAASVSTASGAKQAREAIAAFVSLNTTGWCWACRHNDGVPDIDV